MMRVTRGVLTIACVLAVPVGGVRADEQPKKEHSAVKPEMKDKGRHDKFVAIARKGDVDVLFLGDSITDAWGGEGHGGGAGAKVFEKEFKPLKAANFGIG